MGADNIKNGKRAEVAGWRVISNQMKRTAKWLAEELGKNPAQ